MKRTALLRRTGLRQVSAKRLRENRKRAQLRKELGTVRCEIQHEGCLGIATDLHELKTRARGGSPTDRTNIVYICRALHSWIHDHPEDAEELGLLRHSWEPMAVPSGRAG